MRQLIAAVRLPIAPPSEMCERAIGVKEYQDQISTPGRRGGHLARRLACVSQGINRKPGIS